MKKMTDERLQLEMDKLSKMFQIYQDQLLFVEAEIVARFGVHPSDVDCDMWIDTFHQSGGRMTVEEITREMTARI